MAAGETPAKRECVLEDADAEARLRDAYNFLLLGPDVERIRKLLVRYELAKSALEVPGDIVECGVFKGTGCLYWLKLLHVLEPGSLRRVIGFDTFSEFAPSQRDDERAAIADFVESSGFEGTTPERVAEQAEAAGLGDRLQLVVGDMTSTAREFAEANPGLRISLLHLDLDAYEGTRAALAALYPRVSRGRLVVFDEYAVPEWGESDAADEFMAQHPEVRLLPVPLSAKPTAYFVKS